MPSLPKMPKPGWWLRFVVDHPRQIIFLTFIITLLFAWQIPNLRFKTSIYDLSIEDLPQTQQYKAFREEFGSEEVILVAVKAGAVFEPAAFRQIGELAQALSKIKGVKRAVSLPGIKKAMDLTDRWSLSDFEKIIRPITLFQRNLLSEDKKTTAISLILEDVEEKDRIIDAVEAIIAEKTAPLFLYQIGMPIVSKALASFTQQDFLRLPPITFSLIALVLFLFFRSLRGILIPAGSVVIGLIWTFGLMAGTGTPLSMLTMIVPVFLIAVGTAYGMYIYPEYLASIETSDSPKEASLRCFLHLGFPTALAVFTTTIGLGSLLVNKISAIREFALFSCFGILSMLLVLLTFLPAVLAIVPFPKRKSGQGQMQKGGLDRVLSKIIGLNLRHQKAAFIFIALMVLAGLVGISRIRVENNPIGFFKKDTPVSRHFHHISQDLAGSFPVNVVVDSGADDWFEDPFHLEQIARLQNFLSTLEGVDKTISFADYLKLVNFATHQFKEKYYALPEESFETRMLVNSYKTMLGDDMLKRFMSADFSKANIMLRTHLSSSTGFLSTQRKIEAHLRKNLPKNFTFQVTGIGIVISQSSDLITAGQVKSLSLTLVLVFGIMFFLFMSYKVGLIGMVPNCFPIIINFGMMGWLGIPLSMATSLIASIAIGLAVDDTIHYLVRYNREFKQTLDKRKALENTIYSVGKPIIYTTLTVSIGFSVLMVSNFKPTAVFGLLMVITMFSALVADLILLPSLMLHVELVTIWDLLKLKLGKDPQKGIPLFNGLSRTQVHYVLMAGALQQYEGGDIIMKKGEVSDSMYAVISGKLEVVDYAAESNGDEANKTGQLITLLKAGNVVGEMGMIRSCKRSATVIAREPSELLQINDRMIKRLQWLYPPTAQKFFFNLMTDLCDRLEHATQSYVQSATIDALSGLYTGNHFMDMLEREMRRSRRYEVPLSLLVMEVDNLRQIIHGYGPQGGDFILSETGKLLKQNLRSSDLLCRYDWRRFALCLTHAGAEDALAVCERVNTLFAGHRFLFNSEPIRVATRFGLVSFNKEGDTGAPDLVHHALLALQGKRCAGE
jgi:diguanylate cyclase (GGDEF)-like protein